MTPAQKLFIGLLGFVVLFTALYVGLVFARKSQKGEDEAKWNIFSSEWWDWSEVDDDDTSSTTPTGDSSSTTPAGDTSTTTPTGDSSSTTPAGDSSSTTPAGDSSSTSQSDLSKQYTTKIKNFIDSIQSVHLHCNGQRRADITAKYKEMLNSYVLQYYPAQGLDNFDEDALFCGKDRLGLHLPGQQCKIDATYPGWRNTVVLGMEADFCPGTLRGFYITLKNGKKINHGWSKFLDMDKYTDMVLSEPPTPSTPTPTPTPSTPTSTPTPPPPTPPAPTELTNTLNFFKEEEGPLTLHGKTGNVACGYWDSDSNYVNFGTCEGCCNTPNWDPVSLTQVTYNNSESSHNGRQYTTCKDSKQATDIKNTQDFFTSNACGTFTRKTGITACGFWDTDGNYRNLNNCENCCNTAEYRDDLLSNAIQYKNPGSIQHNRQYATCINPNLEVNLTNSENFFKKKGCGTWHHIINKGITKEEDKIEPIGYWYDNRIYVPFRNVDTTKFNAACLSSFNRNTHYQAQVPNETKYDPQRNRYYAFCRLDPNGTVIPSGEYTEKPGVKLV